MQNSTAGIRQPQSLVDTRWTVPPATQAANLVGNLRTSANASNNLVLVEELLSILEAYVAQPSLVQEKAVLHQSLVVIIQNYVQFVSKTGPPPDGSHEHAHARRTFLACEKLLTTEPLLLIADVSSCFPTKNSGSSLFLYTWLIPVLLHLIYIHTTFPLRSTLINVLGIVILSPYRGRRPHRGFSKLGLFWQAITQDLLEHEPKSSPVEFLLSQYLEGKRTDPKAQSRRLRTGELLNFDASSFLLEVETAILINFTPLIVQREKKSQIQLQTFLCTVTTCAEALLSDSSTHCQEWTPAYIQRLTHHFESSVPAKIPRELNHHLSQWAENISMLTTNIPGAHLEQLRLTILNFTQKLNDQAKKQPASSNAGTYAEVHQKDWHGEPENATIASTCRVSTLQTSFPNVSCHLDGGQWAISWKSFPGFEQIEELFNVLEKGDDSPKASNTNSSSKILDEQTLSSLLNDCLVNLLDNSIDIDCVRLSALADRWLRSRPSLQNFGSGRSNTLASWVLRASRRRSGISNIVSRRLLPRFVTQCTNQKHLMVNSRAILRHLKSDHESANMQANVQALWSMGLLTGATLDDDEMLITLVTLTDCLGSGNEYLSRFANIKLYQAADSSSLKASRLFEPHWTVLAPILIDDAKRRPQILQRFCDLLDTSYDDLLVTLSPFILSKLVVSGNTELLSRIASTSASRQSDMDQSIPALILVLHKELFASIIAAVLTSGVPDYEQSLANLIPGYPAEPNAALATAELIKSNPSRLVMELLLLSGDPKRQSSVCQVITWISMIHKGKRSTQTKDIADQGVLEAFLKSNALAIMQPLADKVSVTASTKSVHQRRQGLDGIFMFLQLGGTHVIIAVPQIRSSLFTSMETPALRSRAFQTWLLLLDLFEGKDLRDLMEITFALVLEYWDDLTGHVQEQTFQVVPAVFKKHHKYLQGESVLYLPSLKSLKIFAKIESELEKMRDQYSTQRRFQVFCERCRGETEVATRRALMELEEFLKSQQSFLHVSALTDMPEPVLGDLIRAILDACLQHRSGSDQVAALSMSCLGLIGCIDPGAVNAARPRRELIITSNFDSLEQTKDFVVDFITEILVKAFASTTDSRKQNFLSFVMQELLRLCDFTEQTMFAHHDLQQAGDYRRWIAIPQAARNILTPLLTSKYTLQEGQSTTDLRFPLYGQFTRHDEWLRHLTFELMKRLQTGNAAIIYSIVRRVIKGHHVSIARYLLPYVMLSAILDDERRNRDDALQELQRVFYSNITTVAPHLRDEFLLCSQDMFRTLDYFSRWLSDQRRRMQAQQIQTQEEMVISERATRVEKVLNSLPARYMYTRALECKSFPRGIQYLEQVIREQTADLRKAQDAKINTTEIQDEISRFYMEIQNVYAQIDEPDAIEGISAKLHVLDYNQQLYDFRTLGRWTVLQDCLAPEWTSSEVSGSDEASEYLRALAEAGSYHTILTEIKSSQTNARHRPDLDLALEAAWNICAFDELGNLQEELKRGGPNTMHTRFATIMQAMRRKDIPAIKSEIREARMELSASLSTANTTSTQSCRKTILFAQALSEIEHLGSPIIQLHVNTDPAFESQTRLDILGPYPADKQFLVGLRRAVLELTKGSAASVAETWLTEAVLARKERKFDLAFSRTITAQSYQNINAQLEYARLFWKTGEQRRAIHTIESILEVMKTNPSARAGTGRAEKDAHSQLLQAQAHLLLSKWLDQGGQIESDEVIARYHIANKLYARWEKGHYYLGKHYDKLLAFEKSKPPAKQAQRFISGETTKLVIEQFLRSLAYGTKYVYHSLPKAITLICDFGRDVEQPLEAKYGNDETFRAHIMKQRAQFFEMVISQFKKYVDRLPAFVLYTAFGQIIARICHSNPKVYSCISDVIVKVVTTHPQQALWSIFAIVKSKEKERATRANSCLIRAQKADSSTKIRDMILQGGKLTGHLLAVSNFDLNKLPGKQASVSLSRDLGFSHKAAAPSSLAMPVESSLAASLPTVIDAGNYRNHRAFPRETITISAFLDDALLLSSLARPRRISARGSDGKVYNLLCKPKDDLRKDQRLLEFNTMITRLLKKDTNSNKRRLYIKTYAVTILNEECGLIEWVEGLKTMREILLQMYQNKGIRANYEIIRRQLDDACTTDVSIFSKNVLDQFPPLLHEWFVTTFAEPEAWYTARLRFTRSCAVMSMVGNALGLGDRHAENVLLQQGNGGVFHVDFNCLFDKGLTFEKPEKVPFRLTHNMVDAFGVYGVEGPFRKACELTVGILRQHEATLMTIMETFLFDPTTDLIGQKKKRAHVNVPDTPEGVLEQVRNKLRGYLPGESMPLSVEGYVQALIRHATDPRRLASMYIGWCPFL